MIHLVPTFVLADAEPETNSTGAWWLVIGAIGLIAVAVVALIIAISSRRRP